MPVATDAAAFGSGQAAATVSAAAAVEASAAADPGAADADGPSTPRVVGVDLRSPFSLAAADDLRTEFTNYVSHAVQTHVCPPNLYLTLLMSGQNCMQTFFLSYFVDSMSYACVQVRGYVGLLDYVWYQPSRMLVKRQIPLPSREDAAAFLPSERFPSDHLSVCTDCVNPCGCDWWAAHAHSVLHKDTQVQCNPIADSRAVLRDQVVADMSWRPDASAADCSPADGSAAAAPASGTPDPASQPLAAELANVPAAVEVLQRACVIAIPTDTLYGEDYL